MIIVKLLQLQDPNDYYFFWIGFAEISLNHQKQDFWVYLNFFPFHKITISFYAGIFKNIQCIFWDHVCDKYLQDFVVKIVLRYVMYIAAVHHN